MLPQDPNTPSSPRRRRRWLILVAATCVAAAIAVATAVAQRALSAPNASARTSASVSTASRLVATGHANACATAEQTPNGVQLAAVGYIDTSCFVRQLPGRQDVFEWWENTKAGLGVKIDWTAPRGPFTITGAYLTGPTVTTWLTAVAEQNFPVAVILAAAKQALVNAHAWEKLPAVVTCGVASVYITVLQQGFSVPFVFQRETVGRGNC